MGAMVVVAVVVVVVLLIAGALWLLRWRGGDEVQSVEGYRHTLDTLQDIRTRSGGGAVRVLGTGSSPAPAPTAEASGRLGEHLGTPDPGHGARTPLVFDDGVLHPMPARDYSAPVGRRDRAMSSMNHRPRRLAGPLLVVAIVAAVLAIVVAVGAHSHKPAPRAASTATTATTAAPRGPTPNKAPTTGSGGGHGGRPHPTPTTAPAPVALVSSSSTAATYSVPNGTYVLTLGVRSGACWVSVNTPSGQTLFTQTLGGAEPQTVQPNGEVTIDIGAPSVFQAAVNGFPLTLPSGAQTPFNLTLQPGAGTGGATSTTTTTAPAGSSGTTGA